MKKVIVFVLALFICFSSAVVVLNVGREDGTSFFTEQTELSLQIASEFNKVQSGETEINCEYVENNTKKIKRTEIGTEFTNYSKGYMTTLPKDVQLDFSLSPLFVDIYNDKLTMRISREWSPYNEVGEYINHYLNRFLESTDWRKTNGVLWKGKSVETLLSNEEYTIETDHYFLENNNSENYDSYSFIIIYSEKHRSFFYTMVKYNEENFEQVKEEIDNFTNNFKIFEPMGTDTFNTNYTPIIPENWTQETRELYEKLLSNEELQWGIFSKDIYNEGINVTIPELENQLEYEFPIILAYAHFNHEFPLEFMQKNWKNGKIVEFTYQITTTNNEELFGYTPNIDMYKGNLDNEIRAFAKKAKEFGHPFLFRINNEMNSDWTSYSGVINLRDPEIYKENWKRIYRIFQEEGVNNAIWIFNPNDRNYPPCDWNNYLAYYPGDEYVQMIGVTGYNTGTYYLKEMGETWRDFDEIYDAIQKEYEPFFSKFPWIITEFSTSSVGGNKVEWINNMFNTISKYKNIKAAVWFNYADFDYREEGLSKVARPYWLDETPETLNAFKQGLNN